jgi:hypothetical protein
MIKLAGGGGGLGSVTTNATLTGAGTGASPLSVAGEPLPYFQQGSLIASTSLAAANDVMISGFVLPYSLTFSNINVMVFTADAVGLYDLGIYSKAGALLAHVGAQSLPATGFQTFPIVGGAQTLAPGLYAFGWTGNANAAALNQDSGALIVWIFNGNVATSVAGVLPSSVGALAIAVHQFPLFFFLD